MKYLSVILLLITGCGETSSNKQELTNTDTLKKWFLYGMPESVEAKNWLAKGYGFQYHQIAGCVVEQEFTDSIDKVNSKLDSVISVNYGSNWKGEFRRKRELLENKFAKAHSMMVTYEIYKNREEELKSKGYYLTYETKPIDTANSIFQIVVFYFLETQRKPNLIEDKTYEIDLNRNSINEKNN